LSGHGNTCCTPTHDNYLIMLLYDHNDMILIGIATQ
jgi:hypothetical protein